MRQRYYLWIEVDGGHHAEVDEIRTAWNDACAAAYAEFAARVAAGQVPAVEALRGRGGTVDTGDCGPTEAETEAVSAEESRQLAACQECNVHWNGEGDELESE